MTAAPPAHLPIRARFVLQTLGTTVTAATPAHLPIRARFVLQTLGTTVTAAPPLTYLLEQGLYCRLSELP